MFLAIVSSGATCAVHASHLSKFAKEREHANADIWAALVTSAVIDLAARMRTKKSATVTPCSNARKTKALESGV